MTLSNKVALITGASRGIGASIALALAREGAQVFGVSRSRPMDKILVNSITPMNADIRKSTETQEVIDEIVDQAGGIDILVNNAGVEYFKPLIDTTPEEYDEMVDTNLRGAFLVSRSVLPIMIARRSGQIIFINSVSGTRGFAEDSVYCASKHGLAGLAESLDEELRPLGIRVCSIYPGATDTRLSSESWAPPHDPKRQFFLKPEDIAETVIFVLKQPAQVTISKIVLRPFIEPIYADFLSPELVSRLTGESPVQSEE
jgi:NADP-dependent 3-hydroxy acid dehydrogenase YdfG